MDRSHGGINNSAHTAEIILHLSEHDQLRAHCTFAPNQTPRAVVQLQTRMGKNTFHNANPYPYSSTECETEPKSIMHHCRFPLLLQSGRELDGGAADGGSGAHPTGTAGGTHGGVILTRRERQVTTPIHFNSQCYRDERHGCWDLLEEDTAAA